MATIKYYIREGLLHPGVVVSATQAEYEESHAERLRLVRALVEVGGLSITTVRELLATLDAPSGAAGADLPERVAEAVERAHLALSPRPPQVSLAPRPPAPPPPPQRALAVLTMLGWAFDPQAPTVRQLEAALDGLDAVGLVPSEAVLRAYASAALCVAEADAAELLAGSDRWGTTGRPAPVRTGKARTTKSPRPAGRPTVSDDSADRAEQAARQALLGTVMYEPLLIALRRLAQHQVFSEREAGS